MSRRVKHLRAARAIREVLKQPQFDPVRAAEQVAVLLAATAGLFDLLRAEQVAEAAERIREEFSRELPRIADAIESGAKLGERDRVAIIKLAGEAIEWKQPSR